jgi:organic radical activating enzyme
LRIKALVDEDFVNYKKPSMFIGTTTCNWKCCAEQGLDHSICQNSQLATSQTIEMPVDEIFHRYISNPITESVVIGGLEPFMQFQELLELISVFRSNKCNDDIVIYTGYYPEELSDEIQTLKKYKNIVIKFGRYIPDHDKHFDEVLGVYLASKNQFARRVS